MKSKKSSVDGDDDRNIFIHYIGCCGELIARIQLGVSEELFSGDYKNRPDLYWNGQAVEVKTTNLQNTITIKSYEHKGELVAIVRFGGPVHRPDEGTVCGYIEGTFSSDQLSFLFHNRVDKYISECTHRVSIAGVKLDPLPKADILKVFMEASK